MRVALIDADIIVWRAAAATQKTLDWDDGEGAIPTADPAQACLAALNLVREWTKGARCERPVLCFSDPKVNYRKIVDPHYKANRKGLARPLAFQAVVDELYAHHRCVTLPALEADDVMGILHTNGTYDDSVIVTLDKDLRGVPGQHYNPNKDVAPSTQSVRAANLVWMTQALMGDRVDNILGIPGVGPVKAMAMLSGLTGLQAMWDVVEDAFATNGMTRADALMTARLTRILRHPEFNPETNEITLWHPTDPNVRLTPPPSVPGATPSQTAAAEPQPSPGPAPVTPGRSDQTAPSAPKTPAPTTSPPGVSDRTAPKRPSPSPKRSSTARTRRTA